MAIKFKPRAKTIIWTLHGYSKCTKRVIECAVKVSRRNVLKMCPFPR